MAAKAHIHQYGDNLYLIGLPVPVTGLDDFIGAWLYAGDPLVLVDVGPSVTVPYLLAALAELGFGSPEWILLTHIHIDHAGAIGTVAKALSNATVVCHPKGIPHLIDPGKLWQGSLKTLGDLAKAYEPIAAISGDRIIPHRELEHPAIQSIETPGHAVHHVSYMIGDLLFAGEAGGVCLDLPDESTYLRPATPPRFFMETSLESIDRLIGHQPREICYGHVGLQDNGVKRLEAHRRQLLHWLDMVKPYYDQRRQREDAMAACAEHLLDHDPLLKGFALLAADIQERERGFLFNSIKGYWGYLEQRDAQG